MPGSRLVVGGIGWRPRLEGNDNAVRADVSDHIRAISLDLGVPERHSHCGEPAPSARTRLRPLSLPIEGVAAAMPEAAHLSHNRQYEHSQGPPEPRTEGKYSAIRRLADCRTGHAPRPTLVHGRSARSAVIDGLEVGWLAVRTASEWSFWAPARSCTSLRRRDGVAGDWADGKCRSTCARRPRTDHAGVARCSAIELPPSTTRYCPVM